MYQHGRWRSRAAGLLSIAAAATVLSAPIASAAAAAPDVGGVALLTVAGTVTLTADGKVQRLGRIGGVTQTVHATPSGDLVVADNTLKLLTPAGKVKVLSATATVDGFAVSRDGHYVAWSVSPGSYPDKSPYKLSLYDLPHHRLVHSRLMTDQFRPVGFLADGRVAVQADGISHQSYLWRPSTGALTKVGTRKLPSVDRASGHLLVLSDEPDGCSALIEDIRTGKTVAVPADARCEFLQTLSPDATRWWSIGLNAVGDRIVAGPGLAAAANGRPDPRLTPLFFERMGITDGLWLDNNHLLLIAQAYKPGAMVGRQLEELCTVLRSAPPTCATIKALGPYERPQENGAGASIGPDVWLVHPLGQ